MEARVTSFFMFFQSVKCPVIAEINSLFCRPVPICIELNKRARSMGTVGILARRVVRRQPRGEGKLAAQWIAEPELPADPT